MRSVDAMTLRESIAGARLRGPEPVAGGAAAWEFCFRADDPTFAGHFPGRPLLPGVFQIEMAHLAVEQVLGCALAVREIEKAKFLRPILPGDTVRLELKWSELGNVI